MRWWIFLKSWWKHKEICTFSTNMEKKEGSHVQHKNWTRAGKIRFFSKRIWQCNSNFEYTKTGKHWEIATFLTFWNLTMHTWRNTYTLKIGKKRWVHETETCRVSILNNIHFTTQSPFSYFLKLVDKSTFQIRWWKFEKMLKT